MLHHPVRHDSAEPAPQHSLHFDHYISQDWTCHLHDASEGPDVGLRAVALSVEDLGRQIIGSTTDCSEKKKKEKKKGRDLIPLTSPTDFLHS